jgi:hypothetical protein
MSFDETLRFFGRQYPRAVEAAQYEEMLCYLQICYPAFTSEELRGALRIVMSHYPEPPLSTMQRLHASERSVVRDFIVELGKQCCEGSKSE